VTLIELQSEVSKIEPSLSAEGKMLVGLFMPFCEEQQLRIKELEDKLAVNSANSSKPPSKDDFKSPKKRSLRGKTNKKPGGQPGHKGQGGPRIKALSVYLSAYQFLPAKRIKDLLAIFGIELSTGTLDDFRKSASGELSCFIDILRQSIIETTALYDPYSCPVRQ